jgi:tetratricopeptide (TPR) repeat protein
VDDRQSIRSPEFDQPVADRVGAERQRRRLLMSEARVSAALSAARAGTLGDLVRQHARAVGTYLPHVLRPVLVTAGDRLVPAQALADAVALWLRWAVTQICPDGSVQFDKIDRAAWLDRTSSRPALAVACHYGMAAIPDFRDRYRRRADEPAADNLCGLWNIGPSTYYRHLDKGKAQIAALLLRARDSGTSTVPLRTFVHTQLLGPGTFGDDSQRHAWHLSMATSCQSANDPVSSLWHLLHAKEVAPFIGVLRRHRAELARRAETSDLISWLARGSLTDRQRFELLLAQAGLARQRGQEQREQELYNSAVRMARELNDDSMLGEAYGELGKFFEFRDADRAFACYEDSARLLQLAGIDRDGGESRAVEGYIHTLVRLAWLYLSRNDPRSRPVLERVQALANKHDLSDELLGMFEQTRGEYWRRAGDFRQALECKHRALNVFERLGDTRSVLVTYFNLSLIYGEARDFERALDYGHRVLERAHKVSLEPETLVNTHGNLGVAHFWKGDYDGAIREYELAVKLCQETGLKTPLSTAHYNLAEAFYKRFQLTGNPEDERRGDMHAAISMRASPTAKDQSHVEATRRLKSEVLGAGNDAPAYDRLLPEEFASHFEEMLQVQRQRAALALPSAPSEQVRARLSIARAYLAIVAKEREAALALINKCGLDDDFSADFAQLRQTFERELTREQRLAALWQRGAADLLVNERRAAVLAALLQDGAINKSGYAHVSGLGLATASKHLCELAARGLLVQSGKGPATKYRLAASD